jgi:DNA-binding response OmpR family regulator
MTHRRPLILVVDDDEQARMLLRTTLQGAGYEVALAADGETALAAIRENPPALVLLDMIMPNLNGWGVIRRLPEKPPPVIAISGEYVAPAALGLAPSCVRAFLVKPFQMRALIETCARILGERPEPALAPETERRHDERIGFAGVVTLLAADRRALAVGRAIELSRRGLRIRLGMDLVPGQKVRLSLKLPDSEDALYLRAVALWSENGVTGLEISEPDAHVAAALDAHLAREAQAGRPETAPRRPAQGNREGDGS